MSAVHSYTFGLCIEMNMYSVHVGNVCLLLLMATKEGVKLNSLQMSRFPLQQLALAYVWINRAFGVRALTVNV